jgi:hypothetical protein
MIERVDKKRWMGMGVVPRGMVPTVTKLRIDRDTTIQGVLKKR